MKTFLRENKLRLFLLGVPVLCLIVLWNINIYQIWWNYFTPWKNYGSPPSTPLYLLRVDFPSTYSDGNRPKIFVYAKDRMIYPLSWEGQWQPGGYSYAASGIPGILRTCAKALEEEWNLAEEELQDAKRVDALGICHPGEFQYVVYQIMQDGSIREKYIDYIIVDNVRLKISFYICSVCLLVMLILRWKKNDPLGLKPDYEAK